MHGQSPRNRPRLAGEFNGANDALTQSVVGPGIQVVRVQGAEMAEALLGVFPVAVLVFTPDIGPTSVLRVVREVQQRHIRTRLFAVTRNPPADYAEVTGPDHSSAK